ncbi:MAG: amidohydrolase [Hyphomonadaceae bacterium]|nr:amidohydrolase [Hyphomonadaceae bacterium]
MTQPAGLRIFDVHAHLISNDRERYPYAPLGGVVDESVLRDPITAERLLDEMDACGVERAVVVQRAHVYGIDNRYVLDAAAASPERFCALVLVNPLAEDVAAAVRNWVGVRGAIGVRLTAPSQECGLDWLASPAALAAWDAARDAGASMRVHFYAWNREAGLSETLKLARRYAETPIVLDHLSNLPPDSEDVDDLLKAVGDCANVSIMFSSINAQRAQAAGVALSHIVGRVVGVFGPERVMWGSDVGQSKAPYRDMVAAALAATAPLPAAAQRDVLWGAASRIYGRP